jgi:hypothetical protein
MSDRSAIESLEPRRLLASDLDATYGGGDGVVSIDNPGEGRSAVVLESGALVVAGDYVTPGGTDVSLVQYRRDGTIDTGAFTADADHDGVLTIDVGSADDHATKVVADAVGFVVRATTGSLVALLRLFRGGQPFDFFNRGRILMPATMLEDFAVTLDGRIVTVGSAKVDGAESWVVQQFGDDGRPDTRFGGGDGMVAAFPGGTARRVLVLGGDLIVAGNDAQGLVRFIRLHADGTPDTTFGTDGVVTVPGSDHAAVTALAPTLYGFAAAGRISQVSGSGDVFYSVYGPTGNPAFGPNGLPLSFETFPDGSSTDDTPLRIVPLADGGALLFGQAALPAALAAEHPGILPLRNVVLSIDPTGRQTLALERPATSAAADFAVDFDTRRALVVGGAGSAVESLATGYDGRPVNVPPQASMGVLPHPLSGGDHVLFSVVYEDKFGIDLSSLDGNDVRVRAPDGSTKLAQFVGSEAGQFDGETRATYRYVPPGGKFDAEVNGTYTLAVEPDQVFDTGGLPVAPTPLPAGTFEVRIPSTGVDVVTERVTLRSGLPLAPRGRTRAQAVLRVTNAGDVGFAGLVSVYLMAYPPGSTDGYQVGARSMRFRLRAGASRRIVVPLHVRRDTMPAGDYTVHASVMTNADVVETDYANNVATTSLSVVASPRSTSTRRGMGERSLAV